MTITGKELTKYGKEVMEAAGWIRLACFNSYRAMPRGARGISDNIYIHEDRQCLLFIEDKGTGDKLRIEQGGFQMHINYYAPPGVHYLIAESKDDYDRYARME